VYIGYPFSPRGDEDGLHWAASVKDWHRSACRCVTVLQRVRDMHENDVELRNQFTYSLRLMSSVYTGALTRHGPFTLFLVTDAGFHRSLTGSEVYTVRRILWIKQEAALYTLGWSRTCQLSYVRTAVELGVHTPSIENKALIDRRLRPRCCHLGSYFKRPKSSPVRPLACNWYYCAQFITKPKAACALRVSRAATSSNFGLWANVTSSIKPEVHNVSLRRQRKTEPWVTCTKIWLRSDTQTHAQTDRQVRHAHHRSRIRIFWIKKIKIHEFYRI